MESSFDACQGIVFHPTLVNVGKHAETLGMKVQLGELISNEGMQRLGLDVLLGLDFTREHLSVVLNQKIYLESGVVLAVVIGRDTTYTNEFLQEVTLGEGSLELSEGIVTKEHVLQTCLGHECQKAAVEHVNLEGIIVLIELERIFWRGNATDFVVFRQQKYTFMRE